ncbi:MAG: CDP-diacylglycerol--glycerol-3-phosphate 3-phosphatidyltransferase [Oscillospiraceae bacterium]|nr:CDP-diacylglycerol--glycerol-3-phosphate 3-phosphatidyltransferase [Oscillospiraceae bacterium]
MNLANKLTVLRIVLVPVFVVFMLVDKAYIHDGFIWAVLVFIIAGITDYIDGRVARNRDMVTKFGEFLDPLADKVLVTAALVCFLDLGWAPAWMVIVIITRDFVVSGVRLVAVGRREKTVIAADKLGKLKTAVTMFGIIIIIALNIAQTSETAIIGLSIGDFTALTTTIIMWIITLLTVISGVSCVLKNKQVLKGE